MNQAGKYAIIQKIVFIIWIILLLGIGVLLIFQPFGDLEESVFKGIKSFNKHLLLLYVIICVVRGIFLLPSTPLILTGAMLFPGQPFLVFIISMIGILLSAILVYYFSDVMGFAHFFEKKYARKLTYLQQKLNQPIGFFLIVFWSCFPLVPTDLICYVAGTVRMNFKKFMLAVFLGELPLVISTIYLSKSIWLFL